MVGENGAGKSTLMKILFGIEQPDAGDACGWTASRCSFANPREAIDAGIGMVFQHFSLVPSFSVYENVVLGLRTPGRHQVRPREGDCRGARAVRTASACKVDPLPPVGQLPVGQQQRVEILKALYRDARILILDEPTAVLAPQEVEELFVAVRALVAQGTHGHLHRPQAARSAGDFRPHHGDAAAARPWARSQANEVTEQSLCRP